MNTRGILTSTVVAAAALTTTVLAAAPAGAATLRLDDPAGDVARGPDVTGVTVRNGDSAVRVVLQLASWQRGVTAVSLDPRTGRGVTLAEIHTSRRTDTEIDAGAFTDRRGPGRSIECRGFRVTRDEDAAQVVFRMPSRCLQGGDYGALRAAAVTISPRSGDIDLAPDHDGDVAFAGLSGSDRIPRG